MPYLSSYAHRGDPGILGSLWRGVKGGVSGFLGGGPLGAVKGAARGIITRRPPPPPRPRMIAPPRGGNVPVPGFAGALQRAIPGGASGMQAGPIVPRGYRLNKSDYFLKDGTFVPAGTRFVKVRSRNPANAKALRRALSRAESFGGLVKRARKTTKKLKNI